MSGYLGASEGLVTGCKGRVKGCEGASKGLLIRQGVVWS